MLVQQFLETSADLWPTKVALVCEGQRHTYAELEAQANRLANALRERDLVRGARVVLYLPNCLEAVVAIFATLKAGGVFVVVNQTTKAKKLAYIMNNCQASALITTDRNGTLAARQAAEVPSLHTIVLTGNQQTKTSDGFLSFANIQTSHSAQRPPHINIDLDLACLIYTSGSTGDPKGVMSDHSNVAFASGSIIQYLENRHDDIVICLSPLSFDYGLYQLLMTFRFGGTLVLERGFTYPAAVLQRIESEGVSGLPGVPTIFAVLLKMDLEAFDLSSLRYLTNTGAALPTGHIDLLRQKLPWTRFYSMYGLTETKRTLYLPPEELESRPDSVGIAIPGTEVWLEDEQGNRLPPGQVGELVVRGRHVMRGYWANPEATARRYRPGPIPGERLCYSGDLFRQDQDGFFYFLSRQDDIIKSRGEKVSPKEVESVLYGLEGIAEAAVVGIPDPILGQAIKAYVVVDGQNLGESEVLAHCRANLEDFMVPRIVEFRQELPKTPSGKIRKSSL